MLVLGRLRILKKVQEKYLFEKMSSYVSLNAVSHMVYSNFGNPSVEA